MWLFMVWSMMFLCVMFFFVNQMEVVFMGLLSCIIILMAYFRDTQLESSVLYLDGMGSMMGNLSIALTCLAIAVYCKNQDSGKVILCLLSGLMAFLLFHINHMIVFFILFEASLIPLIILIIGWGKQPERMMAGKYIVLYTLVSSIPLFCLFVFVEEINSFFSMQNPLIYTNYSSKPWLPSLKTIVTISFMLTFMMKTPMFFLHSWLPKAHVEAPLEGSIILAGIMLKMGTFGAIRMLSLFPFHNWMIYSSIIYIAIVGSLLTIIMAISSDDLKLSIALSSVSHMNFLLCVIMTLKETMVSVSVMVMMSHGFISSMLFFFVTIIYEINNSRSMLMAKGCLSKIPSIMLMSFLFFSMSIAIPPSLPFLGEMVGISCMRSFTSEIMPMVCLFILLNSFYSMMSYGIISHSSFKGAVNTTKTVQMFNMLGAFFMIVMINSFFFSEWIF